MAKAVPGALALALLALGPPRRARACPFLAGRAAGRGLQATYPGWITAPGASEGSLSDIWSPATNGVPKATFVSMMNKSAALGDAELCYWSVQTLPGPGIRQGSGTVPDDEVNLWFENIPSGEGANFGDMASRRMQQRVRGPDGHVVWQGCALGRTLRREMCRLNRAPGTARGSRLSDCGLDAVHNQSFVAPTTVQIFKFRNSTGAGLWEIIRDWRSNASGHVPQMTSQLVFVKGWGPGGQILSKVTPCSDVPAKFHYSSLGDCDEIGDSRLLADEVLDAFLGVCNLMTSDCTTVTATTTATTTLPSQLDAGQAASRVALIKLMACTVAAAGFASRTL